MKAVRALFSIFAALYAITANGAAYVDEGQCFGGNVPSTPAAVQASGVVNVSRGTYLVTAWRQECVSVPGSFALVLKFQATSGTPSVNAQDILVSQAGNYYKPTFLVKNPRSTTLGGYAQIGSFSAVSTIVEQYGARFDANAAMRIDFFDAVLGSTSLNLAPGPTALASAAVETFYGNYSDMWWDPAQNGTGMSIIHHGSNQLFAVWYTYTEAGEPLWLVIPGGSWETAKIFTGQIYKARGTSFAQPWNQSNFQIGASLGTARFTFSKADEMTFSYTVNGVAGQRAFTRQLF